MISFRQAAKMTGVAIVSVALMSGPAFAGYKKIRKEKSFRAAMVGKTLKADDGGVYMIKPDGTLSGKGRNGEKVKGAWNWQGRFWCRNVAVNGKVLPTDCQQIEIDGTRYRMTRERGKGKATEGTLQ